MFCSSAVAVYEAVTECIDNDEVHAPRNHTGRGKSKDQSPAPPPYRPLSYVIPVVRVTGLKHASELIEKSSWGEV
jgi:hypothetical protein